MKTYNEIRKQVIEFLNETNISAYDLIRVGKRLCSCGTCRFFEQHYSKDGSPLDWGHCCKNNIPKSKKPDMQNCGFWELDEEVNVSDQA